uniref:Uncharacterized protein n=1 Tax=Brassica campestris TaxID=3711 RepID=M4EAI3_BRACM
MSFFEPDGTVVPVTVVGFREGNIRDHDWERVTATKRPKNSALEVDLDFEHNARPPPIITEEVTASLEDMIKSRIIETFRDDKQFFIDHAGAVSITTRQNVKAVFDAAIKVVLQPPKKKKKNNKNRCMFL